MPVIASSEKKQIFWCDVCHLKLTNIHTTVQHLCGRIHKAKTNVKNNPDKKNNPANKNKRKQGLNSSNIKPTDISVQEPATKKSKKQPEKASDPNLKCDDCNLIFDSTKTAIQHFKGKRHATSVASKLAGKQRQNPMGGQSGRRGYEGREQGRGQGKGQGRGIGFGRGLMSFGINTSVRSEDGFQARELVKALQMFYSKPLHNVVYPPMHINNMPLIAPKDHLRRINNYY